MGRALTDTLFMTMRLFRNLLRQPAWILISLVQPVVWLLLYGALFRRIVEIPGFGAGSYIDFLTPGVVVMTCLFSAGWSGMDLIEDIDRGVIDRSLVSPVNRSSLIAGRLAQGALVGIVQSIIIVTLGWVVGAEFPGGIPGIAALTLCAALLGTGVGALSNAIGVLSRRVETMVAVSNFVLLPLTFMSSVFMAKDFSFVVSSEADARAFAEFDPEHTVVRPVPDSTDWQVIRKAGTEIRVPRKTKLSRTVGAQIPTGFDPTVWGISQDMANSLDRVALWNIVATVDATQSAGFSPAEVRRVLGFSGE